jgi:CDP-glycerol glycerophosphotransferase (TagB/SpsB family)
MVTNSIIKYYIKNDLGKKILLKGIANHRHNSLFMFGKSINNYFSFDVNIPFDFIIKSKILYFVVAFQNEDNETIYKRVKISFQRKGCILLSYIGQYIIIRNKIISLDNNYGKSRILFRVLENSGLEKLKREARFAIVNKPTIRTIFWRLFSYFIDKDNAITNIFMDRSDMADDNAEVIYDYFSKHPYDKYNEKNYFIIDRKSSDFNRLSRLNYNVVKFHSFRHYLLMMKANNLISSGADVQLNVFSSYHLSDKLFYRFCFLQHGIIQTNLSGWLEKSKKGIDLFICTAKREYNSIIDPNSGYNYSTDVVKLTGLARYDLYSSMNRKLASNQTPQRIICFAPTWRKDLTEVSEETNMPKLVHNSESIHYFRSLFALFEDTRLKDFLEVNNCKLIFHPHPTIKDYFFQKRENFNIEFFPQETSYREVFRKSDLLITDNSSIFFDFAFQGKPIIHYFFTEELNNSIEPFFNYETMGFGPVYKKQDELIDAIIHYINREFIREEKYNKNVKEFFEFFDQNNCKRITKEIRELY